MSELGVEKKCQTQHYVIVTLFTYEILLQCLDMPSTILNTVI